MTFNNIYLTLSYFISIIGIFLLFIIIINTRINRTINKFDSKFFREEILPDFTSERTVRDYLIIKRLNDIIFASFALLVMLPSFIIISIVLKLSSRGPIFTANERVGLSGKRVKIYKFRTAQLSNSEMDISINNYTKVGKFLERYAFDVLPMYFNLLLGDVTLVGRSNILEHEELVKNINAQSKRILLSIKPGLTSFFSIINYFKKVDPKDRFLYDLYYAYHMSPWFDIKILFKTFSLVLFTVRRK
jgi:lipopolysaccharide/colanic/teichoic acid biosynthesis glycosyltransferase